jgi:hypothetical protein
MSTTSEDYLKKVTELFSLYEKVKLCIIYAENFDPKDELYVAPVNQLRSSLDHFLKAAVHPDDMTYELNEAREHMDRAGYDAFEILASNLGKTIIEKLNVYPTDVITTNFPDYYQVIKPKLIEIRANLADIRKRKKNSTTGSDESFSSYFDQVLLLLEFNKNVDFNIPSLEEYQQKKLKEEAIKKEEGRRIRKKERIFNFFIVGIASAVISAIIVYFATTYFADKKEQIKTEIKGK